MLLHIYMPAPTTKNYLTPNSYSAGVEKSWPILISSNQKNFIYSNSEGMRWYILFPSLSRALIFWKNGLSIKLQPPVGTATRTVLILIPSYSVLELGVCWDFYIPECNGPVWFLPRSYPVAFREVQFSDGYLLICRVEVGGHTETCNLAASESMANTFKAGEGRWKVFISTFNSEESFCFQEYNAGGLSNYFNFSVVFCCFMDNRNSF